jgi:hypothetical protein
VLLKLDVAKAYDRVEWEYLRRIILKLGFHEYFVSLIMGCVTSVTFSIRVMECYQMCSDRREEFDKVIPYHLIFFCYVQKAFLAF